VLRGSRVGLVGYVRNAPRTHRVLIQVRRDGHWRTVKVARLNRSGRFSLSWRIRAHAGASRLQLRAVAPRVASSRPLVLSLLRR
jgi:hypothetical protein